LPNPIYGNINLSKALYVLIAYLLLISTLGGFGLIIHLIIKSMVFQGKWQYIIFFLAAFLPIYVTTLSIIYQATESIQLVTFFQVFKDFMVVLAIMLFLLFQKKPTEIPLRLHSTDLLFMAFLGLGFIFLLIPIGEATFWSKLVYLKNMVIPACVYFLGRNTRFDDIEVKRLFQLLFMVALAAFGINLIEVLLGIHIQSFTGYALFNQVMYNSEPTGNYGLSWTFETQSMSRRFASFFSDPLELASSVMIGFAAGLIWLLTSEKNHSLPYLLVIIASVGSLLFSASRAAFGSFFILLFFLAMIFRLYRLLAAGFIGLICFGFFVVFFASEDFYFFILDTLTFQNASSVGHVVEWLASIDSMIENPFGIGLSMSGNLGSVDDDNRIGGENQFLIYGVQLGVAGMLLYILLLGTGISQSVKIFRKTENLMTARIAFTAASVKVGLLLPLFTANADLYAYVSWLSWWMIGYAINNQDSIADEKA
jgi:hypothetical protein